VQSLNKSKGVIHSVEFGKYSRVKSPSRKNLVIDSVYDSGGSLATEWGSGLGNNDKPPMLQIGKIEEDLFAIDFYEITPFQVL
jgi:hypothetical protein